MRRRNMQSSSSSSRNTSMPSSSALPATKPNKMRNIKTKVDGISFASKKEAARYGQLKLLQRAGEITDLQVHPRFDLKVNDQLVCRYIADFSYLTGSGPRQRVVEDVKGRKKGGAWDIFRIKAKLMKAVYDIEVQVI